MKAADIYQAVTDRLIADIENGIADPKGWTKPWSSLTGNRNATTQKAYTGLNQLVLSYVANDRDYAAPIWATYNQWAGIGARVKKGEKATHLIKWVVKPCKPAHPAGFNFCSQCGSGFKIRPGVTIRFAHALPFTNGQRLDTFTFEGRNNFSAGYGRYCISNWRTMDYEVVSAEVVA